MGPEFYTGKGYLKDNALKHNMKIYKEAFKLLPPIKEYNTIIDLGCGIGYFSLLVEKHKYYGIDFSPKVIEQAKAINPSKVFIVSDLLNESLHKRLYKDKCVYVCLEALEHIREDMKVLEAIPSGSPVVISVPNRDFISHVRHFKNQNIVE